jgi:hypothetical protein
MNRVKNFDTFLLESSLVPIKRSELIKKLAPLEGKHNVIKNDIQSLAFVGTKAEMTKLQSELKKLGVLQYFDPMFKDDTQKGVWVIDAMRAEDEHIITKG